MVGVYLGPFGSEKCWASGVWDFLLPATSYSTGMQVHMVHHSLVYPFVQLGAVSGFAAVEDLNDFFGRCSLLSLQL